MGCVDMVTKATPYTLLSKWYYRCGSRPLRTLALILVMLALFFVCWFVDSF